MAVVKTNKQNPNNHTKAQQNKTTCIASDLVKVHESWFKFAVLPSQKLSAFFGCAWVVSISLIYSLVFTYCAVKLILDYMAALVRGHYVEGRVWV